MKSLPAILAMAAAPALAADMSLSSAVEADYHAKLSGLYDWFHAHPELSYMEVNTAARLARELRAAGFEVTEGVGKTGVVAILKNGPGPTVMLRADMDALPVEEKSSAPNASHVRMKDWSGKEVPVMHACGHDVHMTSLVGTAHQMAARRKDWSGTLMLIGQPAEERTGGAKAMVDDQLWARFGKPDVALALHVVADIEVGKIAIEPAPYSGADTLEILIHGVGTHGASPHTGKDPVVLGAQIVMALQEIVSREIAPREPAVITVGAFNAGTKSNIIGDSATLEVSVRSESAATRAALLSAIERVAKNTGRAAGLAENQLPEVRVVDEPVPPMLNDAALLQRLRQAWAARLGEGIFDAGYHRTSMGAEDFPAFLQSPAIPAVYFKIGATPADKVKLSRAGQLTIPYNHSPQFTVVADRAIETGVQASTMALLELMKR